MRATRQRPGPPTIMTAGRMLLDVRTCLSCYRRRVTCPSEREAHLAAHTKVLRTGTKDLRAVVVALALGLFSSGSVAAGLPSGVSGLICTAPNRARLRLNIDQRTKRFQKEGFAILPFLAVDGDKLVLSRFDNQEMLIVASLDLRTLVYTAQSKEAGSGIVARTDYQCVAGPPIDFSTHD